MVLCIVLLAPPVAAQVTYYVTDLGVLGTGTLSQATAINNSGQIVGVSSTSGVTAPHAFLYSHGSLTDLGILPDGGPTSYAAAINDSGVIVGIASAAASAHGFSTTTAAGGLVDLGTLAGGVQSDARGVASNGIIVGQVTLNGVGEGRAFYDSGGVMTNIGDPSASGGLTSNANGVNVVGGQTVIVGYTDHVVGGNTIIDAFTCTIGGSLTIIGNLGGSIANTISKANAISSSGIVVGESSLASFNSPQHAFSYTLGGSLMDLGTLGGDNSAARAVNSAGLIVGDAELVPNDTTHHAFSFITGGSMTDLNMLIPGGSGWTLISATGVNDLGQIVGYGSINGEVHGYVLTTVPEPSACAAMLGLGALGLAACRRHHALRRVRSDQRH
jgi:probable HAF family extracellular repeat protein